MSGDLQTRCLNIDFLQGSQSLANRFCFSLSLDTVGYLCDEIHVFHYKVQLE